MFQILCFLGTFPAEGGAREHGGGGLYWMAGREPGGAITLHGNFGPIPCTALCLWLSPISKSWTSEGSAGKIGFQTHLGKNYSLKPFSFSLRGPIQEVLLWIVWWVEFVMLDLGWKNQQELQVRIDVTQELADNRQMFKAVWRALSCHQFGRIFVFFGTLQWILAETWRGCRNHSIGLAKKFVFLPHKMVLVALSCP